MNLLYLILQARPQTAAGAQLGRYRLKQIYSQSMQLVIAVFQCRHRKKMFNHTSTSLFE